MAVPKIRVMQSFGMPRPTTNPYIVMLRDSLAASEDIEHVPFSWRTALTGSYDVFHVHWPDTLLNGRSWATRAGKRAAFAAFVMRLRLRRTPVVRTVHNLEERGASRLDNNLIAALNRRTTLHIRISASTPASTGTPSVTIPHGHYRDWYAGMSTSPAIPFRLGYAGLIKPYKGVDELIAAFAQTRHDEVAPTLHIAGKPTDAETAARIHSAERDIPGLTTALRYIDEEEYVATVTRAALVVLPYRHMHNSGSALAALSLDRPVLVPDNVTNRALSDEVGAGWVHLFHDGLDADDLRTALTATLTPASARPDLSAREWTVTAAQHAEAYRRAIAVKAAGGSTSPHLESSEHA